MSEQVVIEREEVPSTPPVDQEAPKVEGLPENFKTVEEMAKALKETKAELTRLQQEKPKAPEADLKVTVESAEKEVKDKGLDWDALVSEYEDNGSLSEDTYKTLEDKGIPRDKAQQFVDGQAALAKQFATEVKADLSIASDEYDAMLGWAAEALSAEDKASFNRQVSNMKDPAGVKRAIRGLLSEYREANGKAPRLVKGSNAVPPGLDTFKSWAQVQAAMSDPRYAKDPAYRTEVEQKMARSGELK